MSLRVKDNVTGIVRVCLLDPLPTPSNSILSQGFLKLKRELTTFFKSLRVFFRLIPKF